MILHSKIIGEGRPFVILHGFLGMGDNWKTLGRKFAEQGFQVHLVDQRNHGRSFHDDVFDYDVMVTDLKTYCDSHELQDLVLLGHSMGGKTAMLFAANYPKIVSKLLVADISPRFYPIHHEVILDGLSALDLKDMKSRGEAEETLAVYVPEFGIRQFLLKNLYWKEKGQLALRINLQVLKEHIAEVGESLPNHAEYDGETLFLRGDKSDYIGEDDEVVIKDHFKNASIVTIANTGHWLHAENPQAFYDAVINFIN